MDMDTINSLLKPFLISLAFGFIAGVIIGINIYLK